MAPEFVQMVNLGEKARRGIFWSACEQFGRQGLSFLVFAGLARLVGPESFGVVALAGVYVGFARVFVSQGFGTALIQRRDLHRDHLDSAFWMSISLAAFFCLLTIQWSAFIAATFKQPAMAPVLRWLSLLLPLFAMSSIPAAILTRDLQFRALALPSLAGTLSGGVVGLGMAFAGHGVWSLVVQQLVAAVVEILCLWSATPWRPRFSFSFHHLKDLYRFALNILSNDVLWFFSQRFDHTIVGYRFGAALLGPYSLAARIVQLPMDALAGPLQAVALPALARLQDQEDALKRAFYRFTEVASFTAFPVFGGMAILAPDVIPLLLGSAWVAAVPIIQVFSVYGAVRVAFTFLHPMMLARNRSGLYLILFILNVLGTVISCLIGLSWGPRGVAAAVTVNLLLQAGICLPICQRVLGISIAELFRSLLPPTLATLLMLPVVLAFRHFLARAVGQPELVILCIAAGTATYSSAMLALKPLLMKEAYSMLFTRLRASPL